MEETDDSKVCPYCAETIKKAATVCRYCNRNLIGQPQPVTIIQQAAPQKRNGCATGCAVLVIIITALYLVGSCSPDKSAPDTSPSTPAKLNDPYPGATVTQDRWNVVTKVFEKSGMKVAPRNAAFPDQMDAYLPPSAMDMTERQAKEMALMAKRQLGGNAIVRIKTTAGQTIGQTGMFD